MLDFFFDWGFVLKLVTGVAVTIFGIVGLGTKTRDNAGKLTRNGRIALAGILVTGVLAIALNIYEFAKARKAAAEEHKRSEKLLLSVQRGIFPLRGITVEVTFAFGKDVPAFAEYQAMLRRELPKGRKKCEKTSRYGCGDPEDDSTAAYAILPTSPLYPAASSKFANFLNNLSVQLFFLKLNPGRSAQPYKNAGGFDFRVKNEGPRSITFNPDTGRMEYTLKHLTVPDAEPIKSDIYSLVELFPGFIAAGPAMIDAGICPTCTRPTDEVTIKGLLIKFPFPKTLRFEGMNDFLCDSKEHGPLAVLMLPDDIENLDELGNRLVIMYPDTHKQALCAEFDNPAF